MVDQLTCFQNDAHYTTGIDNSELCIAKFIERLNALISKLEQFEIINAETLNSCAEYMPLLNTVASHLSVMNHTVSEMIKFVKGCLVSCSMLKVSTLSLKHEVIYTSESDGCISLFISRETIANVVSHQHLSMEIILANPLRIPGSPGFPDLTTNLFLVRCEKSTASLIESHCESVRIHEESLLLVSKTRQSLLQQDWITFNQPPVNVFSNLTTLDNGSSSFHEQVKLLTEEVCFFQLCKDQVEHLVVFSSFVNNTTSDQNHDETSGANYHGYNDWTDVDVWHDKGRVAQQLFDTFTLKWRQVHSAYMFIDYPEEMSASEFAEYKINMEWYWDHLRFLKLHVDYEPFQKGSVSRAIEPVLCHPQLGPWTGPYRDLKDDGVNSQYGLIYDKMMNQIQSLPKGQSLFSSVDFRLKNINSDINNNVVIAR